MLPGACDGGRGNRGTDLVSAAARDADIAGTRRRGATFNVGADCSDRLALGVAERS